MNLEVKDQDVYGAAAAFELDSSKEQAVIDNAQAKVSLMVAQ